VSDFHKSALLHNSFAVLQAARFFPGWLIETRVLLNYIAYPVSKASFPYTKFSGFENFAP
jgi:hypothetical protein